MSRISAEEPAAQKAEQRVSEGDALAAALKAALAMQLANKEEESKKDEGGVESTRPPSSGSNSKSGAPAKQNAAQRTLDTAAFIAMLEASMLAQEELQREDEESKVQPQLKVSDEQLVLGEARAAKSLDGPAEQGEKVALDTTSATQPQRQLRRMSASDNANGTGPTAQVDGGTAAISNSATSAAPSEAELLAAVLNNLMTVLNDDVHFESRYVAGTAYSHPGYRLTLPPGGVTTEITVPASHFAIPPNFSADIEAAFLEYGIQGVLYHSPEGSTAVKAIERSGETVPDFPFDLNIPAERQLAEISRAMGLASGTAIGVHGDPFSGLIDQEPLIQQFFHILRDTEGGKAWGKKNIDYVIPLAAENNGKFTGRIPQSRKDLLNMVSETGFDKLSEYAKKTAEPYLVLESAVEGIVVSAAMLNAYSDDPSNVLEMNEILKAAALSLDADQSDDAVAARAERFLEHARKLQEQGFYSEEHLADIESFDPKIYGETGAERQRAASEVISGALGIFYFGGSAGYLLDGLADRTKLLDKIRTANSYEGAGYNPWFLSSNRQLPDVPGAEYSVDTPDGKDPAANPRLKVSWTGKNFDRTVEIFESRWQGSNTTTRNPAAILQSMALDESLDRHVREIATNAGAVLDWETQRSMNIAGLGDPPLEGGRKIPHNGVLTQARKPWTNPTYGKWAAKTFFGLSNVSGIANTHFKRENGEANIVDYARSVGWASFLTNDIVETATWAYRTNGFGAAPAAKQGIPIISDDNVDVGHYEQVDNIDFDADGKPVPRARNDRQIVDHIFKHGSERDKELVKVLSIAGSLKMAVKFGHIGFAVAGVYEGLNHLNEGETGQATANFLGAASETGLLGETVTFLGKTKAYKRNAVKSAKRYVDNAVAATTSKIASRAVGLFAAALDFGVKAYVDGTKSADKMREYNKTVEFLRGDNSLGEGGSTGKFLLNAEGERELHTFSKGRGGHENYEFNPVGFGFTQGARSAITFGLWSHTVDLSFFNPRNNNIDRINSKNHESFIATPRLVQDVNFPPNGGVPLSVGSPLELAGGDEDAYIFKSLVEIHYGSPYGEVTADNPYGTYHTVYDVAEFAIAKSRLDNVAEEAKNENKNVEEAIEVLIAAEWDQISDEAYGQMRNRNDIPLDITSIAYTPVNLSGAPDAYWNENTLGDDIPETDPFETRFDNETGEFIFKAVLEIGTDPSVSEDDVDGTQNYFETIEFRVPQEALIKESRLPEPNFAQVIFEFFGPERNSTLGEIRATDPAAIEKSYRWSNLPNAFGGHGFELYMQEENNRRPPTAPLGFRPGIL